MNITKEKVMDLKPCTELCDWLAENSSIEAAWAKCPRGDWMWWMMRGLDLCSKELSVSFAKNCAEKSAEYAAKNAFDLVAIYKSRSANQSAIYAGINGATTTFAAESAANASCWCIAVARTNYLSVTTENQRQADWLRANFNPFE